MARKVTALDVKLLVATLPEGTNLSAWCRRLGITRPTAYKWRARYRAEGIAGLEDRSRAPEHPHGRSSAEVEGAVVAARKQLAEEGLDYGPASVQSRLLAHGLGTPSESTIWRISVRRGLVPRPGQTATRLVSALHPGAAERVLAGRRHPLPAGQRPGGSYHQSPR